MSNKPKLVLMAVGALIVSRLSEGEEQDLWENIKSEDLMAIREGQARKQKRLERLVIERLKKLDLSTEEGLQKASPEIKSLAKIGVGERDRVQLYASETPEGIFTARIVRQFIREVWKCEAAMDVITGLQVENAGRFRSQGVVRFVQKLVEEINSQDHRYRYQIILNTTAGFKSLVPYATLAGLLFGVPVQYIFETSSELITLPPIPVDFKQDFIRRVEPIFERIEKETALSEQDVFKELSPNEREEILPFLEFADGQYTLSALGLLVYERYKSPPPLQPSKRSPKDKDHTRDWSREPHRSPKFEQFKARLAECPFVESFRYLKGANPGRSEVKRVGDKFHLVYEGIELEVETTAQHESHYAEIERELKRLLR